MMSRSIVIPTFQHRRDHARGTRDGRHHARAARRSSDASMVSLSIVILSFNIVAITRAPRGTTGTDR